MNRSFLMGFSLTLLALMFVLLAGIFFLSQNRTELQEDVTALKREQDGLTADLLQQSGELSDVEATKSAAEATVLVIDAVVSTREAENVALDSQLVDSQLQVDMLTTDLATRTAERDDANAAVSSLELAWQQILEQPPQVSVIAPRQNERINVQTAVDIVVVASHPISLTAVSLSINDEPLADYTDITESVFTTQERWVPIDPGTYAIRVVALNGLGRISEPVTTTVRVEIAPEP